MTPARCDELAAAQVAGRLGAAETAELDAWLAGEPAAAAAWLGAVRRARAARRILAGCATRRRRWPLALPLPLPLAAAAGIALLLGGVAWLASAPSAPRDGSGKEWRVGEAVALGPDATLDLSWPDGCRITLAGAQGRVEAEGARVALDAGSLRAEVEPGHGGIAIATPLGRVEVLGTIFTVAVDAVAVDVAVERGAVRWRGADGATREVPAGSSLAVPRPVLGWTWERGTDRPRLVPGDGGALRFARIASGLVGYTNIARVWKPGDAPPAYRVLAIGAERADLNLLAVEEDGDCWLVANRRLATGVDWQQTPWSAQPTLAVPGGDQRYDPARVRRLIASLWGGPAEVELRWVRPNDQATPPRIDQMH